MADLIDGTDSSRPPLGIVIVAHNNGATVHRTVESVLKQRSPRDRVVLIDCGSDNADWLKCFHDLPAVHLIAAENLGYAGGNNLGWREMNIPDDGFVLFLNPDVLLPDGLLDMLRQVALGKEAQSYAMIGPRLQGYDFLTDQPSGRIDSTGIFPTLWGAWRDRRENSPSERDVLETVPALCGAFLWARAGALRATMLGREDVFDSRYFAYKEDIELSLRLRRAGWKLGVWHGAFAWHGRGWKTRSEMSRRARVLSARNEVRLHATYARRHLAYSLVKWFYARWLER